MIKLLLLSSLVFLGLVSVQGNDHGHIIRLAEMKDGHDYLVYQQDRNGDHMLWHKEIEPFMTKLFNFMALENNVIIDVGANYGTVSFPFASKVGQNGTIYAIEASPPIFRMLEKNIRLNNYNGIVHPYNIAVTDKN